MSIAIQPGRPDVEPHAYDEPRVVIVDDQVLFNPDDPNENVLVRARKLRLTGTWTLRQYRAPAPCGAQFALHPGPDATYRVEA